MPICSLAKGGQSLTGWLRFEMTAIRSRRKAHRRSGAYFGPGGYVKIVSVAPSAVASF